MELPKNHETEAKYALLRLYRKTHRITRPNCKRLHDERSFTSVVSTVIRIFDLVSYPKSDLPYALSIDEFKGNAGGEKSVVLNLLKDVLIR